MIPRKIRLTRFKLLEIRYKPMPDTLVKQPSESRVYDMDFSNLLATSESINSVDSTTGTPSGLTFGTATIDATGKIAQVRISSGADGTTYKVTYQITTDQSNVLEGEGYLHVEDL